MFDGGEYDVTREIFHAPRSDRALELDLGPFAFIAVPDVTTASGVHHAGAACMIDTPPHCLYLDTP